MGYSYLQRGESMNWTNSGDTKVSAGEVVKFGKHIGIAGADIDPGEIGALEVEGVIELPYADATELAAGTDVYYGDKGITAKAGDTTVPAGYVFKAAAAGDTTIAVKIG